MTAFERHQRLVQQLGGYVDAAQPGGSGVALDSTRTDADVLRQSYRFIRRPEDDASDTWETRLARRYYDRLFREFAIADLSRFKEQKVGLRWRTEAEVASGKGQFTCGARGCDAREGLASYELMFRYQEDGQDKATLVKLRACQACAAKLNYGRSTAQRYRPAGGDKEERGRSSRHRSRSRSKSRSKSKSKSKSRNGRRRRHGQRQGSNKGSDSDCDYGSNSGSDSSRGLRRSSNDSGKKRRSHRSRSRPRHSSDPPQHAQHGGSGDGAITWEGPTDTDMDRWLDEVFAAT